MFNWIQIYLIKHFKWMLILLLAVVIVSFVFTIGNFSPLGGSGGQNYREQRFFGYDLSSATGQQEIFGRGQISLSINLPFYASNERITQDYSLSRAAFLHLADEIGLPGPTKEEFKDFVKDLPAFMNYLTQEFDQTRFTAFVDSLTARGLTETFVTGVLEEDYRVDKIRKILQGPGHILEFEAIQAAQNEQTEWTLETAKMPYAEFTADIQPSQEDLESYFQTNVFRYEIDAKAIASFVLFDPRSYIDNAYQPNPGEISIHFFTNKARYQAAIPKPDPIEKEDGTSETPEAPEVTLTDVEEQVIAEIRLDHANKETQKIAEEFAYNLFDKEIAIGSQEFESALTDAGVTLTSLVPYSEAGVIAQNGLQTQTLHQVFRLNESRYFSDPIRDGANYVVLFHQGEEAAYTPVLADVRAKVNSDYSEEKKRALFIEKGAAIKEAVQTAIAGGESFESAAKAQNLNHQAFESFKRFAPAPEGFDTNLLNQLNNINQGEVSDWVATATDGTLVYAAQKVAPTFDSGAEEVKTYLESQRQLVSSANVEPIMRDLLEAELANTSYAQDSSQF
ncbi:MAG: hypothetical protein O7C75_14575 [Verrucomicrobia bacterium]|nr:hypothetical protein [Verrucomicrobiota bacterium]